MRGRERSPYRRRSERQAQLSPPLFASLTICLRSQKTNKKAKSIDSPEKILIPQRLANSGALLPRGIRRRDGQNRVEAAVGRLAVEAVDGQQRAGAAGRHARLPEAARVRERAGDGAADGALGAWRGIVSGICWGMLGWEGDLSVAPVGLEGNVSTGGTLVEGLGV